MSKRKGSRSSTRHAPQFSGVIRPNGWIWSSAEQFYHAAELVWTSEGGELNAFVFPLLVNYALCAERSLKAAEGGAVDRRSAGDADHLGHQARLTSTLAS